MMHTDPYLTLPLTHTRLIQASAGTGKTFTLATLVTRLVVEKNLRISQILAVTFTEAATQELRKRIRERLALAATLVPAAADVGAASAASGIPGQAVAQEDAPDVALSRAIIAAHLETSGESIQAVQRRLQQAADEIDLAAIFTIHGFCARVLREHALESGQTFAPPELLASARDLHDELAADLWRVHAADPNTAEALIGLWKEGPNALSRDLTKLIAQPLLLPAPVEPGPDPTPALLQVSEQLGQAIVDQLEEAQRLIASAFERKTFDGRRARKASFDKAFQHLLEGHAIGAWTLDDKTHLDKLLPERLLGFCKDGEQANVPCSPLFDALAALAAAQLAVQQWRQRQAVQLLHQIRDDARTRLAQLKQQRRLQTYDDLIDGVADALIGPHGQALVQRLRAQYAIALVDEFQDTDPRQWSIFHTVFGDSDATRALGLEPALFLIGDPKQAIYGFRGGDVQTYLAAAAVAEQAPPLDRNFRSRPSVLAAIEALYAQAGEGAFIEPGIAFHPVAPGTQRVDADYLRHGQPAPALTLWQAPPSDEQDAKGQAKPHRSPHSRELATAACVAAIHAVLTDARAGHASIKGEPIQPGDIAVLVRTHREATRIQQALAAVGIPAVAAGKQSLFATAEAHELLTLLLALLHTADDGRLRAALATVLLGVDAAGIAALETDGDAHRAWQLQALDWRERVQRGGPLALVGDLCAAQAERLLGLLDGERRLTNYLQLGELLQHAQARALGLHGLVDWLAQQIAEADSDDETQLLRLESDARRVQIVTLHKSKGLEYPLVFLPFVGIGGKSPDPGHACVVQDLQQGRVLHWKLLPETSGWESARNAWAQAQRAEDARLLYVGLTRAEHALWIATGPFYNARQTALSPMLQDLDALAAQPGIVIDTALPGVPGWLPPQADASPPQARQVTRTLSHDWWVYSFTQLANADSGGESVASASTVAAAGGNDEPASDADADAPLPAEVFDPRFAGNRFGVVMHDALENADFAQWQHWQPGDPAPDAQVPVIERALGAGGYAAEDIDDGLAVLTTLIGQTLTVPLPEGVRLCAVPAEDRRPEIEFQFALQPTAVDALLRLLHRHGVVGERHSFGLRRQLEGLMTGLIDLTYCHQGRWYVLDYKSNRLPSYDTVALQRAMTHSEYDLQALIYTLALHRWLRFRLPGYDYARDFGGIRYLFCRGLDASRDDSPGVHAQRFAPELIDALDALFAGQHAEAAA